MILLQTNSLTPQGERIIPNSLKIDLSERASTVGPQVLADSAPAIGSWVKGEEGPVRGMVFRIRNLDDTTAGAGTYSFTAEHIINTLKDTLLPNEVTPGTMAGNSGAKNCTARQAFAYVLSKQSVWRLGAFDYASVSNPYSFNGENLLTALETVTNSLEDAYWDYDFSSYPFTLNVRRLSDDVDSEMRMSRNITGAVKISYDRSSMYTVIYPFGKNNLKLPEGSLQKNVNLWGRVEHTETDQSKGSVEALRAWAQERLNNHCEPIITVSVTGLYLADITGEPLDRIRINRVCRIPLPQYGNRIIREKVTKLSWNDWVKEPEVVNVTLCNQEQDVASIIRNLAKSSGKRSKTDAQNAEEDHAWFEDTNDHVGMVAEAIIGKSPGGVDWRRISEIVADGDGIHAQVKKVEGDMVLAQTRITQNEDAISLEAQKRIDDKNQLVGRLDVEAGKIGMVVGTKNGQNFIKAGEITLAINEAGESEAHIDAAKVYIGNQKSTTVIAGKCKLSDVTADYIASKIEAVSLLNVQAIAGQNGSAYCYLNEFKGNYYKVNIGGGGGSVTTNDLCDGVYDLQIIQSGNTYTLQKRNIKNSSWVDVGTFERATTSKVSGAWSGGKFTVSADNNGQALPISTDIVQGSTSWSGGTGTIPINYTDGYNDYPTGRSVYAYVAKSDILITTDNVGHSSEPDADAELWSSTNFVHNSWYVFTVNVHGRTKKYKIHMT